jgi:hypothetical protein
LSADLGCLSFHRSLFLLGHALRSLSKIYVGLSCSRVTLPFSGNGACTRAAGGS